MISILLCYNNIVAAIFTIFIWSCWRLLAAAINNGSCLVTVRLPDVWVNESDRLQQKTKVVHLSKLPTDTAVLLDPNIYRWEYATKEWTWGLKQEQQEGGNHLIQGKKSILGHVKNTCFEKRNYFFTNPSLGTFCKITTLVQKLGKLYLHCRKILNTAILSLTYH